MSKENAILLNKKQKRRYIDVFEENETIEMLKRDFLVNDENVYLELNDYGDVVSRKKLAYTLYSDFGYEDEIDEFFGIELLKTGNYKHDKELIRDFAIEYSNNIEYFNKYYGWFEMINFFAEQGKKYGLLREFKENGVC